jgi:hypothetical protein
MGEDRAGRAWAGPDRFASDADGVSQVVAKARRSLAHVVDQRGKARGVLQPAGRANFPARSQAERLWPKGSGAPVGRRRWRSCAASFELAFYYTVFI